MRPGENLSGLLVRNLFLFPYALERFVIGLLVHKPTGFGIALYPESVLGL